MYNHAMMSDDTPQDPLMQFPLPYAVKVMGANDESFPGLVLAVVSSHAPGVDESALRLRVSSGGKYVSVTVAFTAHSRLQLESIYKALGELPQVVMVL